MRTLIDRDVNKLVFTSPEPGCVLYLPGLPGGGSRIYDRSPYGNHGTIIGANWAKLPSGPWCLSFDGTDDYVDLGTSSSLNVDSSKQTTWLIWLKTTNPTDQETLINYSGFNPRITIAKITGQQRLEWYDSGLGMSVRSDGFDFADNEWHLAVIVLNNTAIAFYGDGVAIGSDSSGTFTGGSPDIGVVGGSAAYLSGYMALPRIYHRILSALEIQNDFNLEKQLFGAW